MILDEIDSTIRKINSELLQSGEKRSVIWLIGDNICTHARCTHCSLSDRTFREDLRNLSRNINGYKKFEADLLKCDFRETPVLSLYLMGSFYNEQEINKDLRRKILQKVREEKHIEKLIVETRPEFIDRDKIAETEDIMSGKTVEIGTGLDHLNETYRNKYLNKNITLEDYEKCTEILKNSSIKQITYVAAGCPYLDEERAVESAVETSIYAINRGSYIISIEPLIIQKGTIQGKLYREGKIQLLSQQSIVKITEEIHKYTDSHYELRTGGIVQAPV
ncbi:MAG: hypothetical protein ABRQ38_28240 [Candidatus Eremiobacterota bacterium]